MGTADNKARNELEKLARKHGVPILKRAVELFIGRPEGFDKLTRPWWKFLKDQLGFVERAKAEVQQKEESKIQHAVAIQRSIDEARRLTGSGRSKSDRDVDPDSL